MRTIGLLGGTSWESTAVYYAAAQPRHGRAARPSTPAAAPAALRRLRRARRPAGAGRVGRPRRSSTPTATRGARRERRRGARHLREHDAPRGRRGARGAPATRSSCTWSTRPRPRRGARARARSPCWARRTRWSTRSTPTALRAHGLEVVVPEADERAELQRIVYDELHQGVVPRGVAPVHARGRGRRAPARGARGRAAGLHRVPDARPAAATPRRPCRWSTRPASTSTRC